MAPIGEMAPGCGKRSKNEIFNCIFAPPSERWHRVHLNDVRVVNTRVSATAPGQRGDIRAPLFWHTITTGLVLFRRVFSVYCGIVVPYSAAPMCQLADALRFGHVGACLPTIRYVPVHILPYHRGIDPSERSHQAAYCLQQRCLVRPCVAFTNSASHPSVRWHRGAQKNTYKK